MKLNKFRIAYFISLALLALISLLAIAHTIVGKYEGIYASDGMFFINILSYGAAAFFLIFQMRLFIQSFKNGTLLLNQLCFDEDHKRRKLTGIISTTILVISITLLVIFILFRENVFSSTKVEEYLTYEYLTFFGLFGLIESSIMLSYYIFLRLDDLTSNK